MSWLRRMQLLSVILIAGWCLACDTGTNSNSNGNENGPARNENAAKANTNATPAPSNGNANNSNGGLTKEDVQRDIDKYRKQAKDAGRKVGDSAGDVWLWVKTRTTLTTADDLRDSTIDVDVTDGVVTLSGSVANQSQKTRAGDLTKAIDGVKSVKNDLRIAANGSPNATSDKKAPTPTPTHK